MLLSQALMSFKSSETCLRALWVPEVLFGRKTFDQCVSGKV